MHSAPAVSYPVGRSLFQGLLLAAVAVLTAAVLLLWLGAAETPDARHAGAALGGLLLNGWAAWQWWRTPRASLTWDGSAWNWSDAVTVKAVQPAVVLDLQAGLLLILRDLQGGRTRWAWPERRSAGPRWLAFRRAVFGSRPDEAPR